MNARPQTRLYRGELPPMFTKAALSRSRLALVLASAVVACASQTPSAGAATPSHDSVNFFDASIAWLTGGRDWNGPALRNGVLKARSATDAPSAADLIVTTDATPLISRDVIWDVTKDVNKSEIDIAPDGTATFDYTVSVTHELGPDSGWWVYGVIHVRNPNAFEVAGVQVSDAVDDGGSCTVEGDAVHTVTITTNNSVDLNYTCTYPSAPDPSSGTNTATATWPPIGSPGTSDSGDATFDFAGVEPTIGNGSVDVLDPAAPDDVLPASVTVDDPNPKTFTYSVSYSGDPAGTCTGHTNTAIVTVDTVLLDSADQTVKVCVGADLTVSKTATPSVTRTFEWGISKDVDKTSQTVAPGGTATFGYTVQVTHDGGSDAWKATGTIHVSNPNDWEAVTADVTDAVGNGGVCTVTGGAKVSIPAGGFVELPYTCTYDSAPSPQDGTNTATATWDQASFATPNDSASGTADVEFSTVTPTIVDGSVTVTDTLGGTLGTVSSGDPSPATFGYQHDFSGGQAGTCASLSQHRDLHHGLDRHDRLGQPLGGGLRSAGGCGSDGDDDRGSDVHAHVHLGDRDERRPRDPQRRGRRSCAVRLRGVGDTRRRHRRRLEGDRDDRDLESERLGAGHAHRCDRCDTRWQLLDHERRPTRDGPGLRLGDTRLHLHLHEQPGLGHQHRDRDLERDGRIDPARVGQRHGELRLRRSVGDRGRQRDRHRYGERHARDGLLRRCEPDHVHRPPHVQR